MIQNNLRTAQLGLACLFMKRDVRICQIIEHLLYVGALKNEAQISMILLLSVCGSIQLSNNVYF